MGSLARWLFYKQDVNLMANTINALLPHLIYPNATVTLYAGISLYLINISTWGIWYFNQE